MALARLYADIFRAAPHLAEDLSARHRQSAARAAAMARCGLSKDAAGLQEQQRKRWHEQARQWLRADLAAWRKLLDGGLTKTRDEAQRALPLWRFDPALSGLREPRELEKLSAEEREDCLALWREVSVVLARTRGAR